MKNELPSLIDYLFAEMERLDDEDLTNEDEKLNREVTRARALCGVFMQILGAGHLMSKAYDIVDGSFGKMKLPSFFGKEITNGDKAEGSVAPLQFRGDTVSERQDKRPLLLRRDQAL